MFNENFNAETAIKKWAKLIMLIAYVFSGLCVLASFILLMIDAEYLWWISLILIGSAAITILSASFSSVMVWGFGDLVGNVKKSCVNTTGIELKAGDIDELPEI